MKYFTKEVRIALVAIAGIIILYVGLQFLKGSSLFSNHNTYYVRFSDVSGLSPSSPVYANGIKIGVVEQIDYDYNTPDQIVVAVGLDKQLSLPRGTEAQISSDLLGNVKLELLYGPNFSDKLAVGDTIGGGMKAGLMSKAADMMPQVEQMLPKLDSILLNINTLVSDPALAGTLHHAEELTANLTSLSRDLHQMTASVNQRLPRMMDHADSVLRNTGQLTANLSQLDLQQLMDHVSQTLADVRQLTSALNRSEGTLGLLVNNPDLYGNLNATMGALNALLEDFKAHPKRYINVSVFGKKSD